MPTTTEKILSVLQMQAEVAVHIFEIFAADRATSYQRARRPVRGFETDWADLYRRRQAFHALLNKLKREGLIVQKESRRGAPWHLTAAGARRLEEAKGKQNASDTPPMPKYENSGVPSIVIVAFDIPEKERRKRRWLRGALYSLDFQKVQQSVWLGKRGVPKEFITDLREYKILPYVQIFSVSRGGTLKQTY